MAQRSVANTLDGAEAPSGEAQETAAQGAVESAPPQGATEEKGEAPSGEGEKDKPLPSEGKGGVAIFSENRKGKTIVAVTGKPIVFDADGNAKASQADAEYLKGIPGFEVK